MGEKKRENRIERNELLRELIDDYAEQIKRLAYTYLKKGSDLYEPLLQEVKRVSKED